MGRQIKKKRCLNRSFLHRCTPEFVLPIIGGGLDGDYGSKVQPQLGAPAEGPAIGVFRADIGRPAAERDSWLDGFNRVSIGASGAGRQRAPCEDRENNKGSESEIMFIHGQYDLPTYRLGFTIGIKQCPAHSRLAKFLSGNFDAPAARRAGNLFEPSS